VTELATADDVRRVLASQIAAGELRPGQRLGAERAMAAELGVSRALLRQALAILEDGGLIRRVPGRGGGTFVARGKIDRDVSSRIEGIPALLRSQGVTAGTHVLSARLAEPDDIAAQALRMRPGELAVDLVRLRLADGSPLSLEHAQLPARRFPGLLALPLGGSVYELLEEHYGVGPAAAVEKIEVRLASPEEASSLEVEIGAALLSITRTASDVHGDPFEHSHDMFRGDRTRLVVRSGPAAGAAGAADAQAAWGGRAQVIELRPSAMLSQVP
jgi:GntR family transcriptional regulator